MFNKTKSKLFNNDKFVVLDGATGTELIKRGMPSGVCPELWVIENPHALIDVQQSYIKAGSDIVYVPSFGASPLKLAEFKLENKVRSINRSLAEISRKAVGNKMIFGDIGSCGKLIEPLGELSFEFAIASFKSQIAALLEGGVDGFAIETMMDLQEARAATIAVRELCDLPLIVTMTFEEGGRTLTGNSPISALCTMQSLGVDAFGFNCSTGPKEMAKLVAEIHPFAKVPIIAKPNAGMPHLRNGKTIFDLNPEDFGLAVVDLVKSGATILGGCCGTSPEHISSLKKSLDNQTVVPLRENVASVITSSSKYTIISPEEKFKVIGERINPTGKKQLQAELRDGKFDIVRKFAFEQTQANADILDVNFGLAGIDECQTMIQGIKEIITQSNLPLCIDSTDAQTVEMALRNYPGRALLNSISAEKKRLEEILPIAAKYGAMLILLPLSDGEVPSDFEGRKKALDKILLEVRKYGYENSQLVVDALIMTVSADPKAAIEALKFIEYSSKELKLSTVCGLSNISFGMPNREAINRTFLGMALGAGLTSAIINPALVSLQENRDCADVLLSKNGAVDSFLKTYANAQTKVEQKSLDAEKLTLEEQLFNNVIFGKKDDTISLTNEIISKNSQCASSLVNDILIPAINEVGKRFEVKEYFLPQLLAAASAMECAMKILEPLLLTQKNDNNVDKPLIIIATVKGDIHDIGKNIVTLLLKNHDFTVIDLGKDVSAEVIVAAVKEHNAAMLGLSALMTTTMPEMQKVMEKLKEEDINIPVVVGGAALDEYYAKSIGAYYGGDAMSSVRLAEKLLR